MESETEPLNLNGNIPAFHGDTCSTPHLLKHEPIVAGLVHVPATPAGFATDVANLHSEYRALNSTIEHLTTELLEEHRKFTNRLDTELIPMLDRMQKVLSKRGELHALMATGESMAPGIADLEDVPTWTAWFETFRERVNCTLSLRTVQRKLAELRREKTDSTTGDADHPSDAEPINESSDDQSEREEIKTGQELLTEHTKEMLDVLTGKSVQNDAMRVKRAAEMVKDLQQTIDEGKLFANAPSVEPQAVPQTPLPPTQSSALKPGDCSGLVSSVSNLCGGHLKAVFKELDPEVMTDVFGKFAQRLARMYCRRPSGEALELKVTVEDVTRELPQSLAQRYREFGSFV